MINSAETAQEPSREVFLSCKVRHQEIARQQIIFALLATLYEHLTQRDPLASLAGLILIQAACEPVEQRWIFRKPRPFSKRCSHFGPSDSSQGFGDFQTRVIAGPPISGGETLKDDILGCERGDGVSARRYGDAGFDDGRAEIVRDLVEIETWP